MCYQKRTDRAQYKTIYLHRNMALCSTLFAVRQPRQEILRGISRSAVCILRRTVMLTPFEIGRNTSLWCALLAREFNYCRNENIVKTCENPSNNSCVCMKSYYRFHVPKPRYSCEACRRWRLRIDFLNMRLNRSTRALLRFAPIEIWPLWPGIEPASSIELSIATL